MTLEWGATRFCGFVWRFELGRASAPRVWGDVAGVFQVPCLLCKISFRRVSDVRLDWVVIV
jgi:hypothetical protein